MIFLATLLVAAPNVLSYDVALRPDLPARVLRASLSLEVDSAEATLELAAKNDSITVSSVKRGADSLRFTHQNNVLRIELLPASKVLSIEYEARPSKGLIIEEGWMVARYHTSAWMPCREELADPAILRTTIEAPAGFEMMAAGDRDPEQPNRFSLPFAAPHYLYGFALGRFTQTADGPVRLMAATVRGQQLQSMKLEKSVFAFLRKRLVAPYPFAGYTVVSIPGQDAQEGAGFAVIGENTAAIMESEPRDAWFAIHEAAHQWFGVSVQLGDWADFWIAEGFANFLTAEFAEEQYREGALEHVRAEQRLRRIKRRGVVRPLAYKSSIPENLAGGPVPYTRGQLVLAALEEKLGAQTFWRGVRSFLREHAKRPVRTEMLRAALEQSSKQQLGPFFEQWVYAERPPELAVQHTWSKGQLSVVFTSTAAVLEPIPLVIRADTAVKKVLFRGGTQTLTLAVKKEPSSVSVSAGALPLLIHHERPLAMLEHQLRRGASLSSKMDAFDQWALRCTPDRKDSCPNRQVILEEMRSSPNRVLSTFAAGL
jgi:aminopeptidase N